MRGHHCASKSDEFVRLGTRVAFVDFVASALQTLATLAGRAVPIEGKKLRSGWHCGASERLEYASRQPQRVDAIAAFETLLRTQLGTTPDTPAPAYASQR